MFKKGDVLAFERADNDIFGLSIEGFQELDDWEAKEKGLPVDPDKITHVALVLDAKEYIEADIRGVRIKSLNGLPSGRKIWHCVLTQRNRKKIYDNLAVFNNYLRKIEGTRYDFVGVFQKGLNFITFGLYKPPENNKYLHCDELIYAVFEMMNIFHDINSSNKSPSLLFAEPIFKERNLI